MASRPSCSRATIPLGRLRGSTCFPDDDDDGDDDDDDDDVSVRQAASPASLEAR